MSCSNTYTYYHDGGSYSTNYSTGTPCNYGPNYCVDADYGTNGMSPTIKWWSNYCVLSSSNWTGTFHSNRVEVLTNEFTTEELVSISPGAYPTQWDVGGNVAFATIMDQLGDPGIRDYTAVVQRVQYRLTILAPKDRPYTIPYTLFTQLQNQTNSTPRHLELRGTGTGTPNHVFLELLPTFVYLTNEFGCRDAVGVIQWIDFGCAGALASGGCGSESCSQLPGDVTVQSGEFGFMAAMGLGGGDYGDAHGELIVVNPTPSEDLTDPDFITYIGGRHQQWLRDALLYQRRDPGRRTLRAHRQPGFRWAHPADRLHQSHPGLGHQGIHPHP